MNESTSKRLADYIGVCFHKPRAFQGVFYCDKCSNFVASGKPHSSTDFNSQDGWKLVADEIGKRGEWKVLYKWLYEKDIPPERYIFPSMNGCYFHELQPAKKSAIVAEWRKEVSDE